MLKLEGISGEKGQNIKNAITKKLTELGAYVDNELPNYIMVMVANKKSKAQMTEDLELFLNEATEEFTTWLHDLLQDLHAKDVDKEEEEGSVKEEEKPCPPSEDILTLKEEEDIDDVLEEPTPPHFHTGDLPLPSTKTTTPEQNGVTPFPSAPSSTMPLKKVQIKRHPTRLRPSFLQPTTEAPPPTTFSSVVRIQRKKPSRSGSQPNSTLLVKALQEVTAPPRNSRRSVHSRLGPHKANTTAAGNTENWAPEKIAQQAQRESAEEMNRLAQLFAVDCETRLEEDDTNDSGKSHVSFKRKSSPNSPEISEPHFVVTLDGVEPSKLLSPQRKRSRLTLCSRITPKQSLEKKTVQSLPETPDKLEETQGPSPLPLTAATDMETSAEEEPPSQLQLKERCKFWPSCKFGDKCLFHHPTGVCKNFPMCKFRDTCLFLHPTCKFDEKCTKLDCPFTHTTGKKPTPATNVTAPAGQQPVLGKICKFFPSCSNLNCHFLHPKPCKFGIGCNAKPLCSFYHPPLPSFDQCRWVKTHMPNEKMIHPEETTF